MSKPGVAGGGQRTVGLVGRLQGSHKQNFVLERSVIQIPFSQRETPAEWSVIPLIQQPAKKTKNIVLESLTGLACQEWKNGFISASPHFDRCLFFPRHHGQVT